MTAHRQKRTKNTQKNNKKKFRNSNGKKGLKENVKKKKDVVGKIVIDKSGIESQNMIAIATNKLGKVEEPTYMAIEAVKVKEHNYVSIIEQKLKAQDTNFDIYILIKILLDDENYRVPLSNQKVNFYYSKLFSKRLWVQIKRECEVYRKASNVLIGLDYQDYVFGFFLLKLESIILERRISKIIENIENIECERGVYAYINLVVDPRTLNIMPFKILKTCNDINAETNTNLTSWAKYQLQEKYHVLVEGDFHMKALNQNPNYEEKIFVDKIEELYFSLIAYRISYYEMIESASFNKIDFEFLFFTEIASINNNIYGELIFKIISKINLEKIFIERLSFFYLVRTALSVNFMDLNNIKNIMSEIINSIDMDHGGWDFDIELKKKMELLYKIIIADDRIRANFEKLNNIMHDTIDQRKIRMIKNKKSDQAKNIVKYNQQFFELKTIFDPKITITENKLSYPIIRYGASSIIDKKIKFNTSFDFYLNPIMENILAKPKSN